MATLFVRLISPERIAFGCAGADTSTPAQASPTRSCCLYRHRHPPADQVRLQGVAANRRVEEAVSTHGAVLSLPARFGRL